MGLAVAHVSAVTRLYNSLSTDYVKTWTALENAGIEVWHNGDKSVYFWRVGEAQGKEDDIGKALTAALTILRTKQEAS